MFPVFQWGVDLKKEHEKFLTRQMGDVPVFVSDFPTILKPFYAKATQDGSTVGCVQHGCFKSNMPLVSPSENEFCCKSRFSL